MNDILICLRVMDSLHKEYNINEIYGSYELHKQQIIEKWYKTYNNILLIFLITNLKEEIKLKNE